LRKAGYEVAINDLAAARADPRHPIGLCGYPSVLSKVQLPNPRIFGPGDFGPPNGVEALARDDRYKILTHPSDWFVDLYRPFCGAKLATMFVGIDLAHWRSTRAAAKTCDILIYDKIRWFREQKTPEILERVRRHLDQRGLTHRTLRYGGHKLGQFKRALKDCRAMIFVCEHETQGLAYQEALASDVPVLAWDERRFIDPALAPFASPMLEVSSVPYFDERCGKRFKIADFEAAFDAFWRDRETYEPRAYVAETLSLEIAAAKYVQLYDRLR
jgi:glycosyltransferase involved in cell wall biosynthesis